MFLRVIWKGLSLPAWRLLQALEALAAGQAAPPHHSLHQIQAMFDPALWGPALGLQTGEPLLATHPQAVAPGSAAGAAPVGSGPSPSGAEGAASAGDPQHNNREQQQQQQPEEGGQEGQEADGEGDGEGEEDQDAEPMATDPDTAQPGQPAGAVPPAAPAGAAAAPKAPKASSLLTLKVLGPQEAAAVVRSCSLVLGLHPDQATEQILAFANAPTAGSFAEAPGASQAQPQAEQLGAGEQEEGPSRSQARPFAIVPCCVFPRLFAHRRLRVPAQGPAAPQVQGAPGAAAGAGPHETRQGDDGMWEAPEGLMAVRGLAGPAALGVVGTGTGGLAAGGAQQGQEGGAFELLPVTTYPQLVQYLLQEGGPQAQSAHLRFEGANTVVFRT